MVFWVYFCEKWIKLADFVYSGVFGYGEHDYEGIFQFWPQGYPLHRGVTPYGGQKIDFSKSA